MSAQQLASFFTHVGFTLDASALDDVEKRVKAMAGDFKNVGKAAKESTKDAFIDMDGHLIAYQKHTVRMRAQQVRDERKLIREIDTARRQAYDEEARRNAKLAKAAHRQKMLEQNQQYREWKMNNQSSGGGMFGGGMFGLLANPIVGTVLAGAYLGIAGGKAILDTEMKVNKLNNALIAVTGSEASARQEAAWLTAEAVRLHQPLEEAANGFLRISASALESGVSQEKVRKLFTGTSKLASVFGMSADDVTSTYTALGQIISKKVLMSEELKGQLGERVFGVVAQTAKEMGMGTDELFAKMKKGEISAIAFIDAFTSLSERIANTGDAYAKSTDQAAAKLNDFSNAWFNFKKEIGQAGGEDVVNGTMDMAGGVLNWASSLLNNDAERLKAAKGLPSTSPAKAADSYWERLLLKYQIGAEIDKTKYNPKLNKFEKERDLRLLQQRMLDVDALPKMYEEARARQNIANTFGPMAVHGANYRRMDIGTTPPNNFTLVVNGNVTKETVPDLQKMLDGWAPLKNANNSVFGGAK